MAQIVNNDSSTVTPYAVTDDQQSALAGTSGTPGASNKFVTDTDSRLVEQYADLAAAMAASGVDNEICFVVGYNTFYRYESEGSAYTADYVYVLPTGDGGDTRWIAIGGQYNFGEQSWNFIEDSVDPAEWRAIRSRGAAGQDDDGILSLRSMAYNDKGTPELTEYAQILSSIVDASDGTEDGALAFSVMADGVLTNILELNSGKLGFFGATPAAQQNHVADPSGGGTQDAEARTAINGILDILEAYGLAKTS